MASDTSLIFNLIAKDKVTAALNKVKDKTARVAQAAGAASAAGLGIGLANALDVSKASAKLTAQLGVGPEKAAELSKVAADLYKDAWGDSTEQVGAAVRAVYQQIGTAPGVKGNIQGITQSALALAQTFDVDVSQGAAAAAQMMRTGLADSASEAFDIITKGFQSGVDKQGDFLDTITEYGTQFRKLGITGAQATGILSQGLKAGARDADKVADSIKEFSIRAIDGSTMTAEGFRMLGLDAGRMADDIAGGGFKATQALDLTLDRLRGIKDPVERSNAAVKLFGTQAEDLGDALYALDPSSAVQALGKVGGAADQMASTLASSPAAAIESFKRSAVARLGEITGSILQFGMANQGVVVPAIAVIGGLVGVITAVHVGMMAWNAATTAWTVVTKAATAAQWLMNTALLSNPITWVIIAVIALVAAIVLLWKKNEAFRNFITGAWNWILNKIRAVWNWVKANWPLLLAILTGPIGLAVLAITKNWDKIKSGGARVMDWFRSMPGKIRNALSRVGSIVSAPFRAGFNAVSGFWNRSVGSVHFSVPGWVPGAGGKGFSFPRMPYLAEGGIIKARRGGTMVVAGEAGQDEAVVPLPRGGGGGGFGGMVRVVFDVTGADENMKRMIRKMVRVEGGGNVQVAFGQR
jgi:phage-related minor tail protein